MYIKLDESMELVITVNDPIYRGDNLNRKIIYLIPLQVGEIDMLTANVYLSYIRADGTPDVDILERMDEKYKEAYYQYTLPVTCKLTKYPGEICSWLQIFSGSPSSPAVAKSGECMIRVQESKDMDDYLCDQQMTALYKLHKAVEQGFSDIANDIEKKADSLAYDENTRQLQLKSGDELVGSSVKVPSDNYSGGSSGEDDAGDSTWSDMTDTDDTNGAEDWEPM